MLFKPVIKSLKVKKEDLKEFIFIDDGSTDDSYKILKGLTKNLNNSVVIKQKNKGSANATNQGINLAKDEIHKIFRCR